jgi:hypothetical protein
VTGTLWGQEDGSPHSHLDRHLLNHQPFDSAKIIARCTYALQPPYSESSELVVMLAQALADVVRTAKSSYEITAALQEHAEG